MKVFILQPMRGLTDEEIRKTRQETIEYLREAYGEDTEVIDSYLDDFAPVGGNIPLKWLAKSIELLTDADAIYMCPGWHLKWLRDRKKVCQKLRDRNPADAK